jgi:hypothetical protein
MVPGLSALLSRFSGGGPPEQASGPIHFENSLKKSGKPSIPEQIGLVGTEGRMIRELLHP